MQLVLTRDISSPQSTLGVLTYDGQKFQTIERPWVPNAYGGLSGAKYESCVAAGTYRVESFRRPSGEKAFQISNPTLDVYRMPQDVPAGREPATRTLVLIHAGNFVHDVIGCIAIGRTRTRTSVHGRQEWMITESVDSLNRLRTFVQGDIELSLVIAYALGVGPS